MSSVVSHHEGETEKLDFRQTLAGITNPKPIDRPILSDQQILKTDQLKLKDIEFINICIDDRGHVSKVKARVLNKPYRNDGKWFIYLSIDGDKTPYSLSEYSVVSHQDGTWSTNKWLETIPMT